MSARSQPGAGRTADVLIVGAGIAGSSAAYFAAKRGRSCLVIDAATDCASTVPTALINPVRGFLARCSEEDLEGAKASFALIDSLAKEGHDIKAGRGLWRPVPTAEQRDLWAAELPAAMPHRWADATGLSGVLRGHWIAALYLPESGWVDTASFLGALRKASRAEFVTGEVARVDVAQSMVVLQGGEKITGRTLLWCGGAYGAARIAKGARFRPGSVLVAAERIFDEALSYGLYCAPHSTGSVVGSTTEPQYVNYPPAWDEEQPLKRLVGRARGIFQEELSVTAAWRGVRLESAELTAGLDCLGPFGSRGYLLAPKAARCWADRL